jgi:hypothetical protein
MYRSFGLPILILSALASPIRAEAEDIYIACFIHRTVDDHQYVSGRTYSHHGEAHDSHLIKISPEAHFFGYYSPAAGVYNNFCDIYKCQFSPTEFSYSWDRSDEEGATGKATYSYSMSISRADGSWWGNENDYHYYPDGSQASYRGALEDGKCTPSSDASKNFKNRF